MYVLFGAFLLVGSACADQGNSNIYAQYLPTAQRIYAHMTLDQKIGQLLMPSYVFLANSVSPNGEACAQAMQVSNNPDPKACGLDQIATYHLGAVLTGGGPYFNAPTLQNWVALNAAAKAQHAAGASYDPVFLIGNDAVHGNMHVQGAVLFPHNIGLGVTHDPALVQQMGTLVGQDSLASGFNWVYAPTLAVAQDIRWGRTYESFGQNPALVKELGQNFISGMQDIQSGQLYGPVATAKHFIGDGATQFGLDEGDDAYMGGEAAFWNENGPGFEGAVNANAGSLMVSYSAINGGNTRMHLGGEWDLLNKFRTTGVNGSDGNVYVFNGFVASDWNGVTRAAYFYNQVNHTTLTLPQMFALSLNSGVDMFMLGQNDNTNPFDANSPPNYTNVAEVANALKAACAPDTNGVCTGAGPFGISEVRMQDAVTHILAVKLAMAKNTAPINYAALQAKERKLALQASEESMVLLKNDNHTLPVTSSSIHNVIFIGPTDDLGLQDGGWSVNWQGQRGDKYYTGVDQQSSGATTIEAGVRAALAKQNVSYFTLLDMPNVSQLNPQSTIAIVVLAEMPYAEYMGDIGNVATPDAWYNFGAANEYNFYLGFPQSMTLALDLSPAQLSAIQKLRAQGIKVITVVYSGRPMVLTDNSGFAPWNNSDAVIAAFLPGSLGGQALANEIFGVYHFRSAAKGQSNTLTFPWPRDMSDVEDHFSDGALLDVGYGLSD